MAFLTNIRVLVPADGPSPEISFLEFFGGVHIELISQPLYGRVLFTEAPVLIHDCIFHGA